MGRFARAAAEQRLARPQGLVGRQIERPLRAGTEHTAEFLEQRVCVQLPKRAAQRLPMTIEPTAEGR